MGTISKMLNNEGYAKSLTNNQLANDLLDKIWGKLDLNSWDSALITEAIERLREIPSDERKAD